MKVLGYLASASEVHQSQSLGTIYYKGEGVLRPGYPFFLPPSSATWVAFPCVVLRIGKTGKYVAPQFAYRYIEAIGCGYDITALDLWIKAVENGWPWDVAKVYEGAAQTSEFIPFYEPLDKEFVLTEQSKHSTTTSSTEWTAPMNFEVTLSQLYQSVAAASCGNVIHMGDLIFIPAYYDSWRLLFENANQFLPLLRQTPCAPLQIDQYKRLFLTDGGVCTDFSSLTYCLLRTK